MKFQKLAVLLFGLFLIVQVLTNLRLDRGFFLPHDQIYTPHVEYPGKDFISLIPYLNKSLYAGFWTDFTPDYPEVDIDFMNKFYRSQYAVVPTLLDYKQPFHHTYIVAAYKNKSHFLNLIHQHHLDVLVELKNNIALIKGPVQ